MIAAIASPEYCYQMVAVIDQVIGIVWSTAALLIPIEPRIHQARWSIYVTDKVFWGYG